MSGNVGFIDEEAERRRKDGQYWPRLECKCGNVLVAGPLARGRRQVCLRQDVPQEPRRGGVDKATAGPGRRRGRVTA